MIKTWLDIEKEEQEHYELVLEVAKLREQNKQMKEVLKLIWETDALAQWAWEKGDDDESIADILRETMSKIK